MMEPELVTRNRFVCVHPGLLKIEQ